VSPGMQGKSPPKKDRNKPIQIETSSSGD